MGKIFFIKLFQLISFLAYLTILKLMGRLNILTSRIQINLRSNKISETGSIFIHPKKKFKSILTLIPNRPQIQYYIEDFGSLLRQCGLSLGTSIVVSDLSLSRFSIPFFLILPMLVPLMMAFVRNLPLIQFNYIGVWKCTVLKVYEMQNKAKLHEANFLYSFVKRKINQKRYICFVFGDETGNETEIIVPWSEDYLSVRKGELAYLVILSKTKTIEEFRVIGEAYLHNRRIWISEYPFIKRTIFKKFIETM